MLLCRQRAAASAAATTSSTAPKDWRATAGRRPTAPPVRRSIRSVMAANHNPAGNWDPMTDYAMMRRNVRAFMTLFECGKPVVCKVHGFCVAGGTDMALCSRPRRRSADDAKIGYPPARVWGSPTTALWAHRVGAAARQAPALHRRLDQRRARPPSGGSRSRRRRPTELDARTETLVQRIAQHAGQPADDDEAARQPDDRAQGLRGTQMLGTVFDGIARHTDEGYAFQTRRRRRVPRGGARARRAVRRSRPLDFQGMSADAVRPRASATRDRLIESTIAPACGGRLRRRHRRRDHLARRRRGRHAVPPLPSKEALFVEVFRNVCGREDAAMRGIAAGAPLTSTRDSTRSSTIFARRALATRDSRGRCSPSRSIRWSTPSASRTAAPTERPWPSSCRRAWPRASCRPRTPTSPRRRLWAAWERRCSGRCPHSRPTLRRRWRPSPRCAASRAVPAARPSRASERRRRRRAPPRARPPRARRRRACRRCFACASPRS